ncbi:MAG: YjbH domain-containing protein [Candidatus Cloacimonadota bacterium]|nr:YjbH domain-containing protein [Candidatus Cloacimonadota bacterium]
MKKILFLLGIILFISPVYSYELNDLIDAPTAGILQRGESEISAKIYRDNGLVLGTRVGLFPRFMFGVSYGAEHIVGNENPQWHDRVEFNAKFRLIDETITYPALAVGYDSQGHGRRHEEADRYDIKSKGFYLVASKNYNFMGNLGFHGGINYSFEADDDDDLNVFLGVDKSVGDVVNVMAEYDFAWNDNTNCGEICELEKIGYLNLAASIHFSENLILKTAFYDVLENRSDTNGADRTIILIYKMTF